MIYYFGEQCINAVFLNKRLSHLFLFLMQDWTQLVANTVSVSKTLDDCTTRPVQVRRSELCFLSGAGAAQVPYGNAPVIPAGLEGRSLNQACVSTENDPLMCLMRFLTTARSYR